MSRGDGELPSLDILIECLGLKDLDRSGWLRVGVSTPESVAAHSWGVAWLALLLMPPELDAARVLALAALHDLPEVRAGDITPHDDVSAEEKLARETEAAAALFHRRPDLRALWQDYAACGSAEARFVHGLDKLEMALQALRYARTTGQDTREFLRSAESALDGSALGEVLSRLLAEEAARLEA